MVVNICFVFYVKSGVSGVLLGHVQLHVGLVPRNEPGHARPCCSVRDSTKK